MPLLSSPLILGGANVELVARKALNQRGGAKLNWELYEEALTFVIEGVWYAWQFKWDPARDRAASKRRTPTFSDYAIEIARNRAVDWFRQKYGRNGHRLLAFPHPMDEGDFGVSDYEGTRDGDGRRDPVVVALNSQAGDPSASRDTSLRGILDGTDRSAAGLLHDEARAQANGRTQGRGRGANGRAA